MINHYPSWITKEQSKLLFDQCLKLPLVQRSINIKGMRIPMPRLTTWVNDYEFCYFYSGQETPRVTWPLFLMPIRLRIEELTNKIFSSALINYYRNEKDSVGWHKDNEKWFKSDPTIASLSLGATRSFELRKDNTKEKINFKLSNGDLLIFNNEHVLDWEHSIPKSKIIVGPRLNITFRVVKI